MMSDLESHLGEEMPEINLTLHTIFFDTIKLTVMLEDGKKLVKVITGEYDAVVRYLQERWDLSFLLAMELAGKWMLEEIKRTPSCDGS